MDDHILSVPYFLSPQEHAREGDQPFRSNGFVHAPFSGVPLRLLLWKPLGSGETATLSYFLDGVDFLVF